MLISLAISLLLGLLLSELFKKIHLPGLLGMIIAGIALGPHALNVLNSELLSISSDLREVALIIILARAGLTLQIDDLKKARRPAILMSFLPAIFEIGAMVMLAPIFFNVSRLEAALMGSVVAAVSPAVIVPKMISVIEQGYGVKKSIPQMILASASIDDVFVIMLFTSFLTLAQGSTLSAVAAISIPFSIISGIVIGIFVGFCLVRFFHRFHLRDSQKILIFLSLGWIFLALEDSIKASFTFTFSALIAILCLGISVRIKDVILAKRLSLKFSKVWVFSEIMLFVLVGASVNVRHAMSEGYGALFLVLMVLVFRLLGVFVCLIKTSLRYRERLFCMVSYIPKATVQAAIGSIPLSLGLSSGNSIITVAVLCILITAPLGALLIDKTYKKFLDT